MFTRKYIIQKFTVTGIIFLGKIIMQLNNNVVIVRSLIVHGSHPGEGGAEAGPGVGGGAEAVQLPDGLLQLVSVEDVPEAPGAPRGHPVPGPGAWRGLGSLGETLLCRVLGLLAPGIAWHSLLVLTVNTGADCLPPVQGRPP